MDVNWPFRAAKGFRSVACANTLVHIKRTYKRSAGIGKFRHFLRKNSLEKQIFSEIFVDIFKKMLIIGFCMDTIKDCKIPECGDLAILKTGRVVVGAKQLRKVLLNGRAKFVFMAQNADPALT